MNDFRNVALHNGPNIPVKNWLPECGANGVNYFVVIYAEAPGIRKEEDEIAACRITHLHQLSSVFLQEAHWFLTTYMLASLESRTRYIFVRRWRSEHQHGIEFHVSKRLTIVCGHMGWGVSEYGHGGEFLRRHLVDIDGPCDPVGGVEGCVDAMGPAHLTTANQRNIERLRIGYAKIVRAIQAFELRCSPVSYSLKAPCVCPRETQSLLHQFLTVEHTYQQLLYGERS
mmetsp:Transcript_130328/g.253827  ORF Transcript_130328/g.253827 Transcript_130328/m.253827 type:complete len:228 (-) Transcript_130328:227-910(-)